VPRLTTAPQIRRVSRRQYCALINLFTYLLTYLLKRVKFAFKCTVDVIMTSSKMPFYWIGREWNKLTIFLTITLTNSSARLQFLLGAPLKAMRSWQCANSRPRLISDATLMCEIKHLLNSYKTHNKINKNTENSLVFFNICFIFIIAKAKLNATFPRKRHFRWRHNYVNTT